MGVYPRASAAERMLALLAGLELPERGPARLVAVVTDAPGELLELKRRLARRLSRSLRRDGTERFTPHLTLCRFRRPTRLAPRVEADASGVGAFVVEEVRLMRSVLRREGAEHGVVEGVGLGAG